MGELRDRRFFWPLSMLSKLARAMLYLVSKWEIPISLTSDIVELVDRLDRGFLPISL
jgi:hypothetical protein